MDGEGDAGDGQGDEIGEEEGAACFGGEVPAVEVAADVSVEDGTAPYDGCRCKEGGHDGVGECP